MYRYKVDLDAMVLHGNSTLDVIGSLLVTISGWNFELYNIMLFSLTSVCSMPWSFFTLKQDLLSQLLHAITSSSPPPPNASSALRIKVKSTSAQVACSRRSDSGARAKNKASERGEKKRGETGGEDEGTPVEFSQRKPFRYTRFWYTL